jgi:hypothetical protein
MKAARFLLACAAVSLLAACSANPVAPSRDDQPTDGVAPPSTRSNSGSTTATCSGTVQFVTKPDGTVTTECVVERQHGSGG